MYVCENDIVDNGWPTPESQSDALILPILHKLGSVL